MRSLLLAFVLATADDAALRALIERARAEATGTFEIDARFDIPSQRVREVVSAAVLADGDTAAVVSRVAKKLAIPKDAAPAVIEARLHEALDEEVDIHRLLKAAPHTVDVVAFCVAVTNIESDEEFAATFLPLAHELPPADAALLAEAVDGVGPRGLVIVTDALRRAPDEPRLHEALMGFYDAALNQTFGPVRFEGARAVLRPSWKQHPGLEEAAAEQIRALANAGRADDVLAAFDVLPQAVRNKMNEVGLDLAASAFIVGDVARARAFAHGFEPTQRMKLIQAALAARRDEDLYELLAGTINSNARPGGRGVWTRIFVDLARSGGYGAVADAVSLDFSTIRSELAEQALASLPDALRNELQATLDREPPFVLPAAMDVEPRANVFVEWPLPESFATGEAAIFDCDDAARAAATMHIPAGWYPIRLERAGLEVAAVAISRAVDPMGEVGSGGYWVLHSSDGGNSWDEPLYTGLRENAPYVVVPISRLPLHGRDGLTVEVEVHEIDPASVSFPPVALRTLRDARGLYLDLPWSELRRDSDGDGLTDILEDHLALDPKSADTDRDGITDAKDGLPRVALVVGATPEAEVLAQLLSGFHAGSGALIVGLPDTVEARNACVVRASNLGAPALFLVGDPKRFAPIDINRRVIVFTPMELAVYESRVGMTFAANVSLMIVRHDGKKALIVVNESWKEDVIELEKTEKGWVMRVVGGWIS